MKHATLTVLMVHAGVTYDLTNFVRYYCLWLCMSFLVPFNALGHRLGWVFLFFFFCFHWMVYSGRDTDIRGVAALRCGPSLEICIFGRKVVGSGIGNGLLYEYLHTGFYILMVSCGISVAPVALFLRLHFRIPGQLFFNSLLCFSFFFSSSLLLPE